MKKVKFEDVATRVNTREDKDNTSLLYYVGGDHIESGEMVVHNRGLIEGATIGPMFYFGFKKGDILLVSRNPHLRKAAMVNFDGICSEKTFVIGSKDENVMLQRYLAVVVQTESFWNYCEEHKSGGVNFFVNWSTLAKYEFELPDIEEQRIISDKVWAAYEVKESYRKLITATDELVKSRFIAHFLGSSYTKKRLGDVCSVFSGKTVDLTKENEGGPIAYLKVADLSLPENDRVITISSRFVSEQTAKASGLVPIGATIFPKNGAAALHNKKRITSVIACVDMNTMAVYSTSDTVMPEYLYGYLESQDLAALTLVGAIPQIRAKDVQSLTIPVPSVREQEQYVAIMHQADKS